MPAAIVLDAFFISIMPLFYQHANDLNYDFLRLEPASLPMIIDTVPWRKVTVGADLR